MNFEDPFANDLSRFSSAAAELRRSATTETAGSSSNRGGRDGGITLALPITAAGGTTSLGGRVRGAVTPTTVAAPTSINTSPAVATRPLTASGSDNGAASLFPHSVGAAPVAGRRAGVSSSTGAAIASSVSANAPAQQPILVQPKSFPGADARPSRSAGRSAVTWLGDTGAAPTPAAVALLHTSAPAGGLSASSHTETPSFLDFAMGTGPAVVEETPAAAFSDTAVAMSQSAMTTTTGRQSFVSGFGSTDTNTAEGVASASSSTVDVEARRRATELRELRATLDALDQEQQRLAERLETRQLKEEAEMLALETSRLTKVNELEEKEGELATKQRELGGQTAGRIAALTARYAAEAEGQASELRTLDGARFERQLQQLHAQCCTTEESLMKLRERVALAVEGDPYSKKGVAIAMAGVASVAGSPTAADVQRHLSIWAGNVGDRASQSAVSSASTSASPSLEVGLQKAVELLRSYCDERLRHMRDHLVDYVHEETLHAAHEVRRGREREWAEDAVRRKEHYSQYTREMMLRYMTFYKERAALKEHNITAMQEELHAAATEMRGNAVTRLQSLLKEVSAKMAVSTHRHTTAAEEAMSTVQTRARTVVEGDMAIAASQRRELETRLGTESQARRHRIGVETAIIQEQLHRARHSSLIAAQAGMDEVQNAATAAGAQPVAALQEEVVAAKARIESKLQTRTSSQLMTATTEAKMRAEELMHLVRSRLAEEGARLPATVSSRARCAELRGNLVGQLRTEVGEHLVKARSAQHMHHSRIHAHRKAWEAAHRHNLAAACSLALPLSWSAVGSADAVYVRETHAAPGDVMAVALLEGLRDKLTARDTSRRQLLSARKDTTRHIFALLSEVHEQEVTLHETWDGLWNTAQAQLTQQTTTQSVQLEVEAGLVTVAAQLQTIERDHRTMIRERRRMAEAARQLEAEAAQKDLDPRALTLPPELQTAPADESAHASFLRRVDPNVVAKPLETGKFTSVHTSTNAAAASATTAAGMVVARRPASNEGAETATTSPAETAIEEDLVGKTTPPLREKTSHATDAACSPTLLESTHSPDAHGETMMREENDHSRPSAGATRLRGSGSPGRSASDAPHFSCGSTVLSFEGEKRILPSPAGDCGARERGSSALLPVRGLRELPTWSSLEEFRSSIDPPSGQSGDLDAAPTDGSTTLDVSTDFLDLVSCVDSSTSLYRR